jgi:peptidoglycan hydrolase-like protein with peptidoglycan-binding domain
MGLALVSFLLAGFEARLVRWVLLSEITAAGSQASLPVAGAKDTELGPEHVYEAQVLLNNLGYHVSPITGDLNRATVDSLKRFQTSAELELDGKLTAKSMIELRNRWRVHEEEASTVMAVSEHAVRKTGSRIAQFFRRS